MKKNTPHSISLLNGFSDQDKKVIEQALAVVGQIPNDEHYMRPKGIEVAAILLEFNVDLSTLISAILSDPRLLNLSPKPPIKDHFGHTVAEIVKDVNWLNTITVYSPEMAEQPNQAEILRRMLLSMTQDVRAVLIKLAFRMQRLRGLAQEAQEIRQFIAKETLDIYAPIANRMGVYQLKWELEDMAFRYLQPKAYRDIAKSLNDNRISRENSVTRFIDLLKEKLREEDIDAQICGRPKHIYSIWKKMQRKNLAIDELYDLLAVRVIVDNLTRCYASLGVVHNFWQMIPKEFDDYIANPKENGYQSLHTVIVDSEGNRIEVQIRTQAMHDFAELGVAAHWSYKEGGRHDAAVTKSINSLRKLIANRDVEDESLGESFRNELFHDRVYVLTPKGQLIDLVKNATPLDFAYAIHTEIGHRCRGAKINGRIVNLTYKLKSGEQVEIITTKEGGPNRNWIDPNLGYLKTSAAISKVKSWFKHQQHSPNIPTGKAILEKEIQRLGVKFPSLSELIKYFKQEDANKLYEAIARNDITAQQLAAFFKIPELESSLIDLDSAKNQRLKKNPLSIICVEGVDNVLTSFASCCGPVHGDDIIGFISLKKGITVHRKNCDNIAQLNPEQQARLINVSWGTKEARYFVPIIIHAFSAQNMLNNVTQVLSQAKIHIATAFLDTHPDFSAELHLTIQVKDTDQLVAIFNKISCLPNIIEVKRKT